MADRAMDLKRRLDEARCQGYRVGVKSVRKGPASAGRWEPRVEVWVRGTTPCEEVCHPLESRVKLTFATQEEANAHALAFALDWIDARTTS
jgi:hypothetical protein